MRLIVLAAVLALLGSAAHAQPIAVDVATISMSAPGVPRTMTDAACASDGNDLVCDRNVYVTPNSRMGIGTNSPTAFLDITSSTWGNVLNLGGSDPSGKHLSFRTGIDPDYWLLSKRAQSVSGQSSNFSIFYNTGSTWVTSSVFTPAGLVGIGNSTRSYSPSATLQVAGSIRIGLETSATLQVCDADRTGAIRFTGGDFSFCRNGSAWETLADVASASDRIVSGTSSVVVRGDQGRIYFNVSGTSPASIGPDGRFTTPAAVLTSNTGAVYSDTEYGNHVFSIRNNSVSSGTIEIFMGGDTANQVAYIQSVKRGTSKVSLLLNPQGGNVGIGTAAPSETLHVSGNGRLFIGTSGVSRTGLLFDATPAGTYSRIESYDYGAATGRDLVLNSAGMGNVGVRTGSPTTGLHVNGTLRLANGGEACDANRLGAIRYTGVDFSFCRNGSAWETLTSLAGGGGLSDRITSGTSAVVMNSATGIVSISQLGAVASYVHPSLGYVGPGVSATGTVSASKVAANEVFLSKIGGPCSTLADEGRMFRSPISGRLQVCAVRY